MPWDLRNVTPLGTPDRIPERKIHWPVSLRTRMHFRDLLAELIEAEQEQASQERDDRIAALQQDIRALPGFPRSYDPERDVIVPVTTTAQR